MWRFIVHRVDGDGVRFQTSSLVELAGVLSLVGWLMLILANVVDEVYYYEASWMDHQRRMLCVFQIRCWQTVRPGTLAPCLLCCNSPVSSHLQSQLIPGAYFTLYLINHWIPETVYRILLKATLCGLQRYTCTHKPMNHSPVGYLQDYVPKCSSRLLIEMLSWQVHQAFRHALVWRAVHWIYCHRIVSCAGGYFV